MTASTVTVKLPKDLYARLDRLAKQERTELVELLDRLATHRALRRGRRPSRPRRPLNAFLPEPLTCGSVISRSSTITTFTVSRSDDASHIH
jgi:hypothetical protein